jgi:hypothetical protein
MLHRQTQWERTGCRDVYLELRDAKSPQDLAVNTFFRGRLTCMLRHGQRHSPNPGSTVFQPFFYKKTGLGRFFG